MVPRKLFENVGFDPIRFLVPVISLALILYLLIVYIHNCLHWVCTGQIILGSTSQES